MKNRDLVRSTLLHLCLFGIFSCQNTENSTEKSVTDSLGSNQTEEKIKGKVEEEICYNPNAKGDTSKRSIKSAVKGKIGIAELHITYHSPGVRGRVIWGGLVPYDQVWVTGAHNATTFETNQTLFIDGKELVAGKYALFTIPGKSDWTIIFNKNWNQHLTDDYLQSEDLLRVKVKPIDHPHTERLQYYIDAKSENEGVVAIAWEKLRVELPIKIAQ